MFAISFVFETPRIPQSIAQRHNNIIVPQGIFKMRYKTDIS